MTCLCSQKSGIGSRCVVRLDVNVGWGYVFGLHSEDLALVAPRSVLVDKAVSIFFLFYLKIERKKHRITGILLIKLAVLAFKGSWFIDLHHEIWITSCYESHKKYLCT